MAFDFAEHPHRRRNPLTGQWVQVSPHRAKRPWQGQQEETPEEDKPKYDPKCYLCPGNSRAGGKQNDNYTSTFVFTNDFSALKEDTPTAEESDEGSELFQTEGEQGICRVLCFNPRHDLTLPEMEVSQIRNVVDLWHDEYASLGAKDNINYVQIFENKGEMMGCSNPHPHGQIWAQQHIPDEPAKELKAQRDYWKKHNSGLLCDYLEQEEKLGKRIVLDNEHFAVLVPFWAIWPFETLVVSKRHFGRFTDMKDEEKDGLADVVKRITTRYDNLFNVSFPYSAGFHAAPTDGEEYPEWHFHMHFYPPLLRSATVKKFMVGYEMLGTPQRDITPEWSAQKLGELSETHYKKQT